MLAITTMATNAMMNGGTSGGRSPRSRARLPMAKRDPGNERGQQHHAGQLDDDRGRERNAARSRGRCNDLRDVMDARSDPGTELLVVESEDAAQGRQRHDRERAAEGHERDGEGHLVLVGVDDAVCRRDRRDAADREARGDEQREVVGQAELPTGPLRPEERDRHDADDDEKRSEAEREDVGEDEVEAEQHDAELEDRPSGDLQAGGGCGRDARNVRERDPERDAEDERREVRERPVCAEGECDADPRERETGRGTHHSSGCRNG